MKIISTKTKNIPHPKSMIQNETKRMWNRIYFLIVRRKSREPRLGNKLTYIKTKKESEKLRFIFLSLPWFTDSFGKGFFKTFNNFHQKFFQILTPFFRATKRTFSCLTFSLPRKTLQITFLALNVENFIFISHFETTRQWFHIFHDIKLGEN